MAKLDDTFISYACDILADTESGISGSEILQYCNSYAVEYNRKIPHINKPPIGQSKSTTLYENLRVFEAAEQFRLIKEFCEHPDLCDRKEVKGLK